MKVTSSFRQGSRFTLFTRIIAMVLAVSFLALDISWAYPDSDHSLSHNSKTLAVTSVFNYLSPVPVPSSKSLFCLKSVEVLAERGLALDSLSLDTLLERLNVVQADADMKMWLVSNGVEIVVIAHRSKNGRIPQIILGSGSYAIRYFETRDPKGIVIDGASKPRAGKALGNDVALNGRISKQLLDISEFETTAVEKAREQEGVRQSIAKKGEHKALTAAPAILKRPGPEAGRADNRTAILGVALGLSIALAVGWVITPSEHMKEFLAWWFLSFTSAAAIMAVVSSWVRKATMTWSARRAIPAEPAPKTLRVLPKTRPDISLETALRIVVGHLDTHDNSGSTNIIGAISTLGLICDDEMFDVSGRLVALGYNEKTEIKGLQENIGRLYREIEGTNRRVRMGIKPMTAQQYLSDIKKLVDVLLASVNAYAAAAEKIAAFYTAKGLDPSSAAELDKVMNGDPAPGKKDASPGICRCLEYLTMGTFEPLKMMLDSVMRERDAREFLNRSPVDGKEARKRYDTRVNVFLDVRDRFASYEKAESPTCYRVHFKATPNNITTGYEELLRRVMNDFTQLPLATIVRLKVSAVRMDGGRCRDILGRFYGEGAPVLNVVSLPQPEYAMKERLGPIVEGWVFIPRAGIQGYTVEHATGEVVITHDGVRERFTPKAPGWPVPEPVAPQASAPEAAAEASDGGCIGPYSDLRVKMIAVGADDRVTVTVEVTRFGEAAPREATLTGRLDRVRQQTYSCPKTRVDSLDRIIEHAIAILRDVNHHSMLIALDEESVAREGIHGFAVRLSNPDGEPQAVVALDERLIDNPVAKFHEAAHLANALDILPSRLFFQGKANSAIRYVTGKLSRHGFPDLASAPEQLKLHYVMRFIQEQEFGGQDRELTRFVRGEAPLTGGEGSVDSAVRELERAFRGDASRHESILAIMESSFALFRQKIVDPSVWRDLSRLAGTMERLDDIISNAVLRIHDLGDRDVQSVAEGIVRRYGGILLEFMSFLQGRGTSSAETDATAVACTSFINLVEHAPSAIAIGIGRELITRYLELPRQMSNLAAHYYDGLAYHERARVNFSQREYRESLHDYIEAATRFKALIEAPDGMEGQTVHLTAEAYEHRALAEVNAGYIMDVLGDAGDETIRRLSGGISACADAERTIDRLKKLAHDDAARTALDGKVRGLRKLATTAYETLVGTAYRRLRLDEARTFLAAAKQHLGSLMPAGSTPDDDIAASASTLYRLEALIALTSAPFNPEELAVAESAIARAREWMQASEWEHVMKAWLLFERYRTGAATLDDVLVELRLALERARIERADPELKGKRGHDLSFMAVKLLGTVGMTFARDEKYARYECDVKPLLAGYMEACRANTDEFRPGRGKYWGERMRADTIAAIAERDGAAAQRLLSEADRAAESGDMTMIISLIAAFVVKAGNNDCARYLTACFSSPAYHELTVVGEFLWFASKDQEGMERLIADRIADPDADPVVKCRMLLFLGRLNSPLAAEWAAGYCAAAVTLGVSVRPDTFAVSLLYLDGCGRLRKPAVISAIDAFSAHGPLAESLAEIRTKSIAALNDPADIRNFAIHCISRGDFKEASAQTARLGGAEGDSLAGIVRLLTEAKADYDAFRVMKVASGFAAAKATAQTFGIVFDMNTAAAIERALRLADAVKMSNEGHYREAVDVARGNNGDPVSAAVAATARIFGELQREIDLNPIDVQEKKTVRAKLRKIKPAVLYTEMGAGEFSRKAEERAAMERRAGSSARDAKHKALNKDFTGVWDILKGFTLTKGWSGTAQSAIESAFVLAAQEAARGRQLDHAKRFVDAGLAWSPGHGVLLEVRKTIERKERVGFWENLLKKQYDIIEALLHTQDILRTRKQRNVHFRQVPEYRFGHAEKDLKNFTITFSRLLQIEENEVETGYDMRRAVRPGEVYFIVAGVPGMQGRVYLEATEVSKNKATFSLTEEKGSEEFLRKLPDNNITIRLTADPTLSHQAKPLKMILASLAATVVTDQPTTGDAVTDAVLGLKISDVATASEPIPPAEFFNKKLAEDPDQAAAVAAMIDLRKKLTVTQGPPGGGKTTTIVEAVRQLWKRRNGKIRILVLSQTHVAVNNVALRLIEAEEGIPVVPIARVGNSPKLPAATATQDTPENMLRAAWQNREAILMGLKANGGGVVLGTIAGFDLDHAMKPSRKHDYGKFFDMFHVVIVEEAGKATVGETLLAAQAAVEKDREDRAPPQTGKLILVGDHKQLPPTGISREEVAEAKSVLDPGNAFDEEHIATYETSLFEYLWEIGAWFVDGIDKFFLSINRRSHPAIVQFLSRYFYGGKLKVDPERSLIPEEDTFRVIDYTGTDYNKDGNFEHKVGTSWSNLHEANLVLREIDRMLNKKDATGGDRYSPKDIFIINPYRGQIPLMEKALSVKAIMNDIEAPDADRDTVLSVKRLRLLETAARSGQQNDLRRELSRLESVFNDKRALAQLMESIRKRLTFWTDKRYGSRSITYKDLDDLGVKDVDEVRLETFDSIQGDENKVAIVSFVRSNRFGGIGHLKKLKRLCVALSRAQESLIMIGDFTKTLTRHTGDDDGEDHAAKQVFAGAVKHAIACRDAARRRVPMAMTKPDTGNISPAAPQDTSASTDGMIARGNAKELCARLNILRETKDQHKLLEAMSGIIADLKISSHGLADADRAKALAALQMFHERAMRNDIDIKEFDSVIIEDDLPDPKPRGWILGFTTAPRDPYAGHEDPLDDLQDLLATKFNLTQFTLGLSTQVLDGFGLDKNLLQEYLFHEILCPIFGHHKTRMLQEKVFDQNYANHRPGYDVREGRKDGRLSQHLKRIISSYRPIFDPSNIEIPEIVALVRLLASGDTRSRLNAAKTLKELNRHGVFKKVVIGEWARRHRVLINPAASMTPPAGRFFDDRHIWRARSDDITRYYTNTVTRMSFTEIASSLKAYFDRSGIVYPAELISARRKYHLLQIINKYIKPGRFGTVLGDIHTYWEMRNRVSLYDMPIWIIPKNGEVFGQAAQWMLSETIAPPPAGYIKEVKRSVESGRLLKLSEVVDDVLKSGVSDGAVAIMPKMPGAMSIATVGVMGDSYSSAPHSMIDSVGYAAAVVLGIAAAYVIYSIWRDLWRFVRGKKLMLTSSDGKLVWPAAPEGTKMREEDGRGISPNVLIVSGVGLFLIGAIAVLVWFAGQIDWRHLFTDAGPLKNTLLGMTVAASSSPLTWVKRLYREKKTPTMLKTTLGDVPVPEGTREALIRDLAAAVRDAKVAAFVRRNAGMPYIGSMSEKAEARRLAEAIIDMVIPAGYSGEALVSAIETEIRHCLPKRDDPASIDPAFMASELEPAVERLASIVGAIRDAWSRVCLADTLNHELNNLFSRLFGALELVEQVGDIADYHGRLFKSQTFTQLIKYILQYDPKGNVPFYYLARKDMPHQIAGRYTYNYDVSKRHPMPVNIRRHFAAAADFDGIHQRLVNYRTSIWSAVMGSFKGIDKLNEQQQKAVIKAVERLHAGIDNDRKLFLERYGKDANAAYAKVVDPDSWGRYATRARMPRTERLPYRRSAPDGSVARGLATVNGVFRDRIFTADKFRKKRVDPDTGKPYSMRTVYSELNGLVRLGIILRTWNGRRYVFWRNQAYAKLNRTDKEQIFERVRMLKAREDAAEQKYALLAYFVRGKINGMTLVTEEFSAHFPLSTPVPSSMVESGYAKAMAGMQSVDNDTRVAALLVLTKDYFGNQMQGLAGLVFMVAALIKRQKEAAEISQQFLKLIEEVTAVKESYRGPSPFYNQGFVGATRKDAMKECAAAAACAQKVADKLDVALTYISTDAFRMSSIDAEIALPGSIEKILREALAETNEYIAKVSGVLAADTDGANGAIAPAIIPVPAQEHFFELHEQLSPRVVARLRQEGRKILISEALFNEEVDTLQPLRVSLDKELVEILPADEIVRKATNRDTPKDKLACIVTRAEAEKYWKPESARTANKATILALEIRDEKDRDLAYVSLEGLIGLADAMMRRDETSIRWYVARLFDTSVLGDADLEQYLKDNDSVAFVLKTVLKLRPPEKFDLTRIDDYKKNTELMLSAV